MSKSQLHPDVVFFFLSLVVVQNGGVQVHRLPAF
jgi:hypothetical protein